MSAAELLPPLRIELGGVELEQAAASTLGSVRVSERLSLPALCELAFLRTDRDPTLAKALSIGSALRVRVGDDRELFAGEVTGVGHCYGSSNELEIRVRAYDLLHRLRKRQPVRSHIDVNLRVLAERLVSDLGVEVESSPEGPVWPRVMQWYQSDLELLRERAARCGLHFFLDRGTLRFCSLAGIGSAVAMELGRDLIEAYFDGSTEPACRSVRVRAWNAWTAGAHEALAHEPRSGRAVDLDAAPELIHSSGRRTLTDEAAMDDREARALAQAELDRRSAGEVCVRGVSSGETRIGVGRPVRLRGVAKPFVGRYVVTSVVHTLDRALGFRSHFETSPPEWPDRPRGSITTLGIVIDVTDPRDLGRVRVALPNFCDLESDWLAVLAPGGGPRKGLVMLPDVGDRVLISLPREDPARGIVLGGLYGEHGPPESGVRDERVLRYTLVTRGGQRLYLEEEDKTVRLENGTGNYIVVSPGRARIANSAGSYVDLTRKRVRVHAEADLEIEAPGRALVFRSASVDFQTG